MEEKVSAARAMHLVRRQRHSFLNHLQVISGWLQLDRPDRARQYLETIAAHMSAESQALKQATAPLGLLMLELDLEAETHGVHLEWRVGGAAESLTDSAAADLHQAVLAGLKTSSMQVSDDRRITVHLTADGFAVHTPSDVTEE